MVVIETILGHTFDTFDTFVTRDTCTPDTMALLGPSRDRPSLGVGGMAAWRPRKNHARSPCLSVAAVQCLSVAHITAPSDQQHLASFILRGRWPHARRRRGSDRSIAILLAPNSHSSAQTPTPSTFYLYTYTLSLTHTFPSYIHHGDRTAQNNIQHAPLCKVRLATVTRA